MCRACSVGDVEDLSKFGCGIRNVCTCFFCDLRTLRAMSQGLHVDCVSVHELTERDASTLSRLNVSSTTSRECPCITRSNLVLCTLVGPAESFGGCEWTLSCCHSESFFGRPAVSLVVKWLATKWTRTCIAVLQAALNERRRGDEVTSRGAHSLIDHAVRRLTREGTTKLWSCTTVKTSTRESLLRR